MRADSSRLTRGRKLILTSLATGVSILAAGLAVISCGGGTASPIDDVNSIDASQIDASRTDASACDGASCSAVDACTSDAECTDSSKPHCNPSTGKCVENSAMCDASRPCSAGKECCDGGCVDRTTDLNNCGACGKVCAEGSSCCNSACVNAKTDAANCGGCGVACTIAHGSGACNDGKCAVATCETGYDDCDKDPLDGCEVDTRVSATNCGECGKACSGNHITATCSSGQCVGVCEEHYIDCNSDKLTDGCELDTRVTPQTFELAGAPQSVVVPSCMTHATIEAYGAQGGSAVIGGTGGLGGLAQGVLTVTPGDVLQVYVGGQNGYNGGGAGGRDGNTTGGGAQGNRAPSGGGASDVRLNGTALTDRVIVAGGGGGAGDNGVWPSCQTAGPAGAGGAGGALDGVSGTAGTGTPCNCGGGGGGGYYGGGAGGSGSDTTPGGGGGGGSSYVGTLASASTTAGARMGDGRVIITFSP